MACHVRSTGGMDACLRFLNRPVIIKRADPTRRMRIALWCLLVLWPLLHRADLVTTGALVFAHPGAHREGDLLAAWVLAHGGVGALALHKALIVAVVLGPALFAFRWFPRLTLALLALLSALVAVAVVNNMVLLLLGH